MVMIWRRILNGRQMNSLVRVWAFNSPRSLAESRRTGHKYLRETTFSTLVCLGWCLYVCGCKSAWAFCDLIDHDNCSLRCGHLHGVCSRSLHLYFWISPSIAQFQSSLLHQIFMLLGHSTLVFPRYGPTFLMSPFSVSSPCMASCISHSSLQRWASLPCPFFPYTVVF